MSRLFLFMSIIAMLAGCSKQDIPAFDGLNSVAFYRLSVGELDSMSYSFGTVGFGKQTDTLFIPMRVIGSVENVSRPVKLRAASGTTARVNIDYKLPAFSVPAGASTFRYPLVVNRTPEMKTQVFRLVLEAEPNETFPGVTAPGLVLGKVAAENTVSLAQMKIDITEKIIRPSFWNATLDSKFGTYSDVKYAFMVQALGTGDFAYINNGGKWTLNDYDGMLVKLRAALTEYKKVNGSLIDENGNAIEF